MSCAVIRLGVSVFFFFFNTFSHGEPEPRARLFSLGLIIRAERLEPGRLQNLAAALELAGHKSLASPAIKAPFAVLRFQQGITFTAWGDEFTIEQRVRRNSIPDSKYLMALARSVVQALGFESLNQISLKSYSLQKHSNPFEFMTKTLTNSDGGVRDRLYTLRSARVSFIYDVEPRVASVSSQSRPVLTVSVAPRESTSAMRVPHLSVRADVTFTQVTLADFLRLEGDGTYYSEVVDEVIDCLLAEGPSSA